MRKWSSNCADLLRSIPDEMKEFSSAVSINDEDFVKALGLQWHPVSDCFSFVVAFPMSDKPTKRSLLSDASKLFDPLGWLAPTTIIAKIIFQKL